MTKSLEKRGAWMVAMAAAMWGTWSLFLRWSGLAPLTSGAIFMSVLALGGVPAQWMNRHRERPRSVWAWMALFGLLDAGNTGFFFLAVMRGPIAVATLTHYLAPVLTPVMAWLILRERPSKRTYPAALIGLCGLVLLLNPGRDGVGAAGLTALFGAASGVFYSTLAPLGKKLSPHFSPLEVQGIHSYLSAALLWGAVLLVPASAVSLPSFGKLLLGSCFCGLFAGALFYRGIRAIPAGVTAVLTYVEPVVATTIGALRFHEPLSPSAYLGAALVVGGGLFLAMEPKPASNPSTQDAV